MRRGATILAVLVPLLTPLVAAAEPAVRFGVQIAPAGAPMKEILEAARVIEELGYDDFWMNDHFVPREAHDEPQFESWTTLAGVARETTRIRIGILVSGNTYRNPALLAKMATTVDHLSEGRLNFGIGAGWDEFEHRAYGFPFHTAKERAERLAESLEVITRLWTKEVPSFEGEFYRLEEAPFVPRPIQKPHPPIVVGGQGKDWIMPTVARYADEWNVPIGVSPDGIRERLGILRETCAKIGRAPCVEEVSVFLALQNITAVPLAGPLTRLAARVVVGNEVARSVLAGSVEDVRDHVREYVDAGATAVIVTTRPGTDLELLRRFAEEIVPAFR